MYSLLSYLAWRVIQVWPEGPLTFDVPPPPDVPFRLLERLPLPDLGLDRSG